ncbi:2-succinyl-5-enolpyruvyl-6-hydroxy-3-cyclohexene-1-carboxylic-acid synthase, partial [filamentous cyanobacterium CCP2]
PTPHSDRGILIAGVAQPRSPKTYCQSIAHLAKTWGIPVLAEGLSPVRNHADLNPYLISTYDLVLRNQALAEKLAPEWVIRVGEMPTSKELRQWLAQTQPRQWIIEPSDRNLDPSHGKTTHLRTTVEQFAEGMSDQAVAPSLYLNQWCEVEAQARQAIDQIFDETEAMVESKVAWLLSQYLPNETPLFIANSTPVRDVEWFWKPGKTRVQPFFNRGANGIDGTLSTALGVMHQRSGVLLTGDLSLLHDTNGFLLRHRFRGHLTIVLINNNGGGIFELLPISQFEPPFEDFFATPQAIDFSHLCTTYGIKHELIQSWEQFIQRLNPLPKSGIRVLEVQCDRKADAQWRKTHLNQWQRMGKTE